MIYVTDDRRNEDCDYCAGNKAINDVADILYKKGAQPFVPVDISPDQRDNSLIGQVKYQSISFNSWKREVDKLSVGDKLVIQYPFVHARTIFFAKVIQYAKKQGIKVILFLHDVDSLRSSSNPNANLVHRLNLAITEKTALRKADYIIAHNNKMKEKIADDFKCDSKKIIPLKLFDYLSPGKPRTETSEAKEVVIAGNLFREKAGYIYTLPQAPFFNLYGINAEADKLPANANYKGVFNPDDGPNTIDGAWGLVWDGDSVNTCSGGYGTYLRINNPHKASLYLAAGLPLIVWGESALSPYILNNKLGIAVSSLKEVEEQIRSIDQHAYETLKTNALHEAEKLRAGYHTRKALYKIGQELNDQELLMLIEEKE